MTYSLFIGIILVLAVATWVCWVQSFRIPLHQSQRWAMATGIGMVAMVVVCLIELSVLLS